MSEQLSNPAREALLATNREYLARTLDALYLVGWRPSCRFTETHALAVLQPLGVGRRALRRALAERAFFPVEVIKRKRGRPVQFFELPTPTQVSELLQVAHEQGDRLTVTDLARGAYKLALHREIVKRRNGLQTSLDWLAGRLHVHRRTIRRFNKKLKIRVEHVFERSLLTPEQALNLPQTRAERPTFAYWLETLDGFRYAPVQGVLAMLGHLRLDVLWVRQMPNRYWLPAG